jgi:hypothetical protein
MPDNVAEIAQHHGFSSDAARALVEAIRQGGGTMAQFNHPELGGMGQWTAGGMIMIGDMFNNGLKARVDALCHALASAAGPIPASAERDPTQDDGRWWPADLDVPSASGAQNDMRYAFFPDRQRLAIRRSGVTRVYDTGDHRISGFSQQQSSSQSLAFTSQTGSVRLEDLKEV